MTRQSGRGCWLIAGLGDDVTEFAILIIAGLVAAVCAIWLLRTAGNDER